MIGHSILDFGAVGDGISDDAKLIQSAIDHVASKGGGKVVFPAGYVFLSGPITLKSNIEYIVEAGCTLLANPDEQVYTESAFRDNLSEGTIWIGAEGVENITISGAGNIDGNGVAFMGKEGPYAYELMPIDQIDRRPHTLTIIEAKRINIRGVTFKNSSYWGIHLVGCDGVLINNIFIYNDLKIRNSDGIDLDHCTNVNISNCHIESGDDCICFKNRREYQEYGPCTDITIASCTLLSTSCAIKFGSENVDDIKNIVISNCIIKNSNRGIGFQNRDEGSISNVLISNVLIECRLFSDVWWGKAEPIYISSFSRSDNDHRDAGLRLPKGVNNNKAGTISNIRINNVQCSSENGIFISGDEVGQVYDIKLSNIDLTIDKTTNYQGGLYDCRPCARQDFVKGSTHGVYLENVSDVQISNCHLRWGTNKPDYFDRGLLQINSSDIEVSSCSLPNNLDAVKEEILERIIIDE